MEFSYTYFRSFALKQFTGDPLVFQRARDYLGVASSDPAGLSAILLHDRIPYARPSAPGVRPLGGDLPPTLAAPLVVVNLLAFVLGWGLWGVWWGISIVN